MQIVVGSIASAIIIILMALLFLGRFGGRGPFSYLRTKSINDLPGNAERYSPENAEKLADSPLAGKSVFFLGSSVTYGASSKGVSFVEYMAKRDGLFYSKEAVGGTTLTNNGPDSYFSRLKEANKEENYDLFVCQLSTNDASKGMPLGEVFDTDTSTVCGAINVITDYARENWHCPVVFFTNARFDSEPYAKTVEKLHEIAKNKDIFVIDLFNDESFNDIPKTDRSLYMADTVHPTQAGYLLWWTPEMERQLYRLFQ